jgi:hypothetical protein
MNEPPPLLERLTGAKDLARIAQAVQALGLGRDQSIDLLVARLEQICANGQGRPGQTGSEKPLEQNNLPECPKEVGTADAAKILGVSKDTVLKLRDAGLLPYRNAAPPGGARPMFRFPLDAVLELRNGYRTEEPVPRQQAEPPRRRVRGKRKYKHLQLED